MWSIKVNVLINIKGNDLIADYNIIPGYLTEQGQTMKLWIYEPLASSNWATVYKAVNEKLVRYYSRSTLYEAYWHYSLKLR